MITTHPSNTITDQYWHDWRNRWIRSCPDLIRFGSAESVRQTRMAGLRWRAARLGWN